MSRNFHKETKAARGFFVCLVFALVLVMSFVTCSKAQKIDNATLHYYVATGINDITYSAQGLVYKERSATKKLIISCLVTEAAIVTKETFDKYRPNESKRTGWSWNDFWIGNWSIPIYIEARIVINDVRKKQKQDERIF